MNAISTRTRLGLDILIAATAGGVIGDALLRAMPWGLNVPLAVTAFVAAAAIVIRRAKLPVSPDLGWIALSAVLLGVAFVRRAADTLQVLDIFGLLGVLMLGTLSAQGVAVRVQGVADYVRATVLGFASTVVGILPLAIRDITWSELPVGTRLRHAPGAALGVAIAFPLLLIFGSLFAAADATFASFVERFIAVDFEKVASHTVLFGLFTTLAGGYLWTALVPKAAPPANPLALVEGAALGIVPVGTALGLVNLVFLLFVAVQAPYFFGGQAVVTATTGLTLAEFARSGFFELVTASALVLPLLLAAQWGVRKAPVEHLRSFRALAVLLLLQLGAVMGSALLRMQLYVGEFGLSQDRVYATAFMAYLAIASAWFGWTVLRGRGRRFAFGAGIQGYAVLAALHLVNVDGLIVRENVSRAAAGADFDVRFHTRTLSADAVPALVASLPKLSETDRQAVQDTLLARWVTEPQERGDWRSWNWSVAQARRAIAKLPGRAVSRKP